MKVNAKNQRDWADQQIREKKAAAAAEKQADFEYAQQQDAIGRMIGMLQDEGSSNKAQMMKKIQQENQAMALAKRQKEDNWKKDQQAQNLAEVTLTNHGETLGADGRVVRN